MEFALVNGMKLYFFQEKHIRQIFLLCCLVLTTLSAHADLEMIEVFDEEDGDILNLYAHNKNEYVYTIFFEYSKIKGFENAEDLPEYIVIPAGAVKFPLFTLRRKENSKSKLNYTVSALPGDVTLSQHEEEISYLLPFASNTTQLVGQGYKGRHSHKNTFALDFNMSTGSTVCAARGGKVVDYKDDSNIGGPRKSYMFDANYVTIEHDDGSFAVYAHLDYRSCDQMMIGDRVEAGQPIAKSGNSGFSSGPHLHFEVYILTPKGKKTIPTLFQVAGSKVPIKGLKEKQSYTATPTGVGASIH